MKLKMFPPDFMFRPVKEEKQKQVINCDRFYTARQALKELQTLHKHKKR